ncbi:carboxypeptidase-like regulatory domain-containing protein [Pseudochryseolinea flava]|uniref:Carboxypeptidase-like regulatory domain-containing protein n=1 Tax=Pseudochryseolinea flava TaxID=2059302 RepID=A0A364Y484_9BACT|nr:carboxypeptidase-like regulatory domain-containing protein [Pseudochryseolinea flava]RAW00998.1 hypothetical protein DQQ10_12250 [Pseudochryseolinea flava]
MNNLSAILFLVLCYTTDMLHAQSATKSKTFEIAGTVISQTTKKPMSFASIRLKNSLFGTSSDEHGKFLFKANHLSDTLEISFIGFKTKRIALKTILATTPTIIALEEHHIEIPETIVVEASKEWAKELFEQVIDSIHVNFVQEPILFNTVIHASQAKDDFTQQRTTINADIYFGNGYNPRKKRNDFLVVKGTCITKYDSVSAQWSPFTPKDNTLIYEVNGIFLRDVIAYRDNLFLNKKNLSHYAFDVESEDEATLTVRFKASTLRVGVIPFPNLISFSGKVEINKTNFSITKIIMSGIVDEDAMIEAFNKSTVGELEITTEYKSSPNGKLYWARSLFKENFQRGAQIIIDNSFIATGVQPIHDNDWTPKAQNLCD